MRSALRATVFVGGLLILQASCGDDGGTGQQGQPVDVETPSDGYSCDSTVALFAADVVSFDPGEGAGFGADQMPQVVLGPPEGAIPGQGSTDTVSLGAAGSIVLELDGFAVDCDGDDFVVFENPFDAGSFVYTELAEVSVSQDGETWATFPCDLETMAGCAGVNPVATGDFDGDAPNALGGDGFDLSDVGLEWVRYVRIEDKERVAGFATPPGIGFDLDAIGVAHGLK